MKKLFQTALLWLAGLVGMLLLLLRKSHSGENVRVAALKAEALRLKELADGQRAKHDAELKVKVAAIAEERAKPVDSVDFANDLLKE